MKLKNDTLMTPDCCRQPNRFRPCGIGLFTLFLAVSALYVAGDVLAASKIKAGDEKILKMDLIDPPSTLTGTKLRISQVMQIAYSAGFQTEEQLVAVTAIAISELGLWSSARNWQPDRGYRPASDQITVQGPTGVFLRGRQMHSDRGLWQIASFWYPQYSDVVTDNPKLAAVVVYELSNGGADFSYWDSYAAQRSQKHHDQNFDGWPAVRPLVKRFLSRVQPIPKDLEFN